MFEGDKWDWLILEDFRVFRESYNFNREFLSCLNKSATDGSKRLKSSTNPEWFLMVSKESSSEDSTFSW